MKSSSSNIILAALIVVTLCLIFGVYMTKKDAFMQFNNKKDAFYALTSPSMIAPPPMPVLEVTPPSFSQNQALAMAPRTETAAFSDAVNTMTGPYVPGPGYVGRETYDVSAPIPCDPFSNSTCFTRV